MDTALIIIIVFFLLTNLFSLLLMFVDKIKARIDGAERISEGMLFFLAAAFGALGVYLGMFLFRHKTRKWYFQIGIPLVFLENCALLYSIYLFV